MPPKDLKESLTSHRKADITHVRSSTARYLSRACEYGGDKYERANYMRPTGDGAHDVPTRADLVRYQKYLRAGVSHAMMVLDDLEYYFAMHPHAADDDVREMREAAYAADTDPCEKIGPSHLSHLCGSLASFQMAIEQAIRCNLLPTDPGCPWKDANAPIHKMRAEREAMTRHAAQLAESDAIDWGTSFSGVAVYRAGENIPAGAAVVAATRALRVDNPTADFVSPDAARFAEIDERLGRGGV